MLFIILVVNAPKLSRYFPQSAAVMVSPRGRDRELTYLELPSDVQKVTKRPDTDIISDKDRIATSRKPHVDPKELRKILDSSRPGRPGMPARPASKPLPAQPAQAGSQQAPQPQAPQSSSQPEQQQPSGEVASPAADQVAKLTPPSGAPAPSFSGGSMLPGTAIEEAARAAAASRGGGSGGEGGDNGLNRGRGNQAQGQLEVLSDTMGVDFGPYLARVVQSVKQNWYNLIPEVARAPIMKKGKVTIEFAITKNGSVAGLRLAGTSGDVALDRAAYGGITGANPFPPLPNEFGGQYLALRFYFYYNPGPNEVH